MPYENDIFLSYRRFSEEWLRWTHKILVPMLRNLLQPALGNVTIYTDMATETGDPWPDEIAWNLVRSRIMVAVLSRDYFRSDWCRAEIAHMCKRQELFDSQAHDKRPSLIFPLVIDDGDCFPEKIRRMKFEEIHGFAQPYMAIDGANAEQFIILPKNWALG